jgi:hypothetical protein
MPRFSCPHCQSRLDATAEQRGEIVTCTDCGRRVRVPAAKPAPAAARAPARHETAPAPAKPGCGKAVFDEDEEAAVSKAAPDVEEEGDETPAAKKSSSSHTATAIGGIGALVALALFLFIISGRWVPIVGDGVQKVLQQQGIPPIVAAVVTGLVFLIPLGIWGAVSTKSAVVRNVPEKLKFLPVNVEDFAERDAEELDRLTGELDGLGFRQLMDYRVKTELDTGVKGFGRLFVHPEEHAFAEINQAFTAGGSPTPMGLSLISLLDGGWSFSTSNRKPTAAFYLIRRPKGLWVSRPEQEPAELWETHLERRQKIADDLGVETLTEDTAEAYFENERRAAGERKKAVQRRSAIQVAIDKWLFDKTPKYEWMGSYRPKGKKRKS